jgi:hypothetical protein
MLLNIRTFDAAQDLSLLNAWADRHALEDIDPALLPRLGLIASVEGAPVAVGFLTSTDTCSAIVEYLVSDPLAPSASRALAIDGLLHDLLTHARVLGFKRVWCITKYESIVNRAKALGGEILEPSMVLLGRSL